MKKSFIVVLFTSIMVNLFVTIFGATSNNLYNENPVNESINYINSKTNEKNYKYIDKEYYSNNPKNLVWAGKALQYFLYKHSNINDLEYINKLVDGLGYDQDKGLVFRMNIVASTVVVSLEGMTSYNNFFSESFIKWLTDLDSQKNFSWELLNYFFINIYDSLKSKASGFFDFKKIQSIINDDFKQHSANLIYDLKSEKLSNSLTYQDLLYSDDLFGMINFNDNDYPYLQNALLSAASFSSNNNELGLSRSYINSKSTAEYNLNHVFCKNNDSCINYDSFKKFNNYYYKKASNKSILSFKSLLTENKKFESFDELDTFYKNHTNNKRKYPGSNITLSISISELSKLYNWTEEKIDYFKNSILNCFNSIFKITNIENCNDSFEYAILGIIFSQDNPLNIQSNYMNNEYSESYTGVSYIKSRFNSIYESVGYSYLIISGDSLNRYSDDINNHDFKNGIYSGSNIFSSFFDGFGRVLGFYLGRTEDGANHLRSSFEESSFKMNNSTLYKGSILGWNKSSGEAAESLTRSILLAIYLFITFICLIIIVIISGFLIAHFIKKAKNKDKTAFKK